MKLLTTLFTSFCLVTTVFLAAGECSSCTQGSCSQGNCAQTRNTNGGCSEGNCSQQKIQYSYSSQPFQSFNACSSGCCGGSCSR